MAATKTEPTAPAKKPRISVLERRLQNPFGSPSIEIQFKESGWTAHWFNRALATDKIWRAKNNGWDLVYEKDMVDLDQIGGYVKDAGDGHITRGDRGQEVLMRMPTDDFNKIQWAKTRVNLERTKDFDKDKQDLLNAHAKQFGGNATELFSKTLGPVGGVTTNYERIERTAEE